MPRTPRKESPTKFYHVTARGAGRRAIFEDSEDHERLRETMRQIFSEESVEIHAWCHMRNHMHLLLRCDLRNLSHAMQRLETSYSHYFNGKCGHVGPVFQGRYGCEPIHSEEHFLMTLCYIHQNPLRAGESDGYSYPWSSYEEYLGNARKPLCDPSLVLEMLGGIDGFARFHDSELGLSQVALAPTHHRIADSEAERIARSLYGPTYKSAIALLPKKERDRAIRRLKVSGLSVRQIERLTGIGRNIVSRA